MLEHLQWKSQGSLIYFINLCKTKSKVEHEKFFLRLLRLAINEINANKCEF